MYPGKKAPKKSKRVRPVRDKLQSRETDTGDIMTSRKDDENKPIENSTLLEPVSDQNSMSTMKKT